MGDIADMEIEAEAFRELFCEEIYRHHRSKPVTRHNFIWTDIKGGKHKLKDIDDPYLQNIINFVKRKKNLIYEPLIKFLEDEQQRRAKGGLIKRIKSYISRIRSTP
jgi:hypothetical protein